MGVFTPPLVAGRRVFVLGADRSLNAFDAASGARLWQQNRPGDALSLRQAGLLMAVGDTLVAGQQGRLARTQQLGLVVGGEDVVLVVFEDPVVAYRGHRKVLLLILGVLSVLAVLYSLNADMNVKILYPGLAGLVIVAIWNSIEARRCAEICKK